MKKILFLAFLILLSHNDVSSQEVVIKYKINNQIITNLDIKKEAKYLSALNIQLKNLSENQLELIATESLITETVKKIELNDLNLYPASAVIVLNIIFGLLSATHKTDSQSSYISL